MNDDVTKCHVFLVLYSRNVFIAVHLILQSGEDQITSSFSGKIGREDFNEMSAGVVFSYSRIKIKFYQLYHRLFNELYKSVPRMFNCFRILFSYSILRGRGRGGEPEPHCCIVVLLQHFPPANIPLNIKHIREAEGCRLG